MAIKKLQNNFTTPEQSKRLLELGVPADSADCIYPCYKQEGEDDKQIMYGYINVKHPAGSCPKCYIPCWSAGRLIEIFAKCKMYGEENKMTPLELYADEINGGLVEFLVDCMYNYNNFDFSKLEE